MLKLVQLLKIPPNAGNDVVGMPDSINPDRFVKISFHVKACF